MITKRLRLQALLGTTIFLFVFNNTIMSQAYIVDVQLLDENMELVIEIINTSFAVTVAVLAALLARLLKGTPFERGWKIIIGSTITFVLFEAYGLLEAWQIIRFTGGRDILEFLIIGQLLLGTFIIYRSYKHYAEMLEEQSD